MDASQSSSPGWASTRTTRDVHGDHDADLHIERQPGAAMGWSDDRGAELEIVAAVLPDFYRVIHLMPAPLRRTR